MTRFAFALLLWLAFGWAQAGLPETPRPRQLTVADGLPSNNVNAIAEDRDGYLWIATSDGLARYDGLDFKVWRVEDGLPDNMVWSVQVDARNRVWAGTQRGGLAVLDARRKQFRVYNRRNTPAMGSDAIWSVATTPDGAVWFGTESDGLHRLDPSGKVTRYMPRANDPRSLPGSTIVALKVSPRGELWVGTRDGAARWTGRDFERVPEGALPSPSIQYLSVERDGTVWFNTALGVVRRRPDGHYSAAPWSERTEVLARDRTGQYWLDIKDGGLGIDNEGAIQRVPLFSAATQSPLRPLWSDAFEDREGSLWFASSGQGLWHLPPDWRHFAALNRRLGDPATLGNGQIFSIAPAAGGDMWLVGLSSVLDRLDPESGRVEHVVTDVAGELAATSVHEDRRGAVWIGYTDGLARLDPITRELRRWSSDSASDPALKEHRYFAETADLIWVASSTGEIQARDLTGAVRESVRAGISITSLLVGHDGALWLTGAHGVSMWNAGAHRFEALPGAPTQPVAAIAIEGRDTVWLASPGVLQRYRWDGAALQPQLSLGVKEGVPLTSASGMLVDIHGNPWLATTRGLLRVDPQTRSVRLYDVSDGLPSQDFDMGLIARPADGRILVAGSEGIIVFDPAAVRPSAKAPRLVIDSIDVRRGEQRVALPVDRGFRIEHDDRDLRVTARVPSLKDGRTHVYRFRLRGYDSDWVEVRGRGERVFSQLQPGAYQLDITARTAEQVWSPVRTLAFSVAPPWWRLPWVMVLMAVIGVLLLWWAITAYRERLKRRHAWQLSRQQQQFAEQQSQAKTRFLATLGHEVRTPLTGVLGMSELLLGTSLDAQQRGYTESIHGAGEHLLRLVNDALDLARIESGRLELADEPFDLRALIDDVAHLMGPLARKKGLEFQVEIAPYAPRGLRGDGNRVRQILLNLLGNAIKFTEHGRVSLRVAALVPRGLQFEIADTGPGLSEEQKQRLFRRFEQAEGARTAARYGGSGLGLAICQELVTEMRGSISVESSPGAGARFVVELPLENAAVPTAEAAHHDAIAAPSQRSLLLLLVEDDAVVAEVVTGLLRKLGHRVTHVPHALAALTEAASTRFDAALLDLDLPGMDGLALARQLRTQGFDRPLIAITARADADAQPEADAAGFDAFIRKPVTSKMLKALLEAAGVTSEGTLV